MSDEIKMGVKDEMEHTSSKKIAKKIAKDHLKKDPKYYTKLKKAGLEEEKLEEANSKATTKIKYSHYIKKRDDLDKSITSANFDKNPAAQGMNQMIAGAHGSPKRKKAVHKLKRLGQAKAVAGTMLGVEREKHGLPKKKFLSGGKKLTEGIMKAIKEATLGGAKLAGKSNPNNVKSKKSGFTINSKMNDAYSKVPDAKGLVRKRLLQKGKAAWNVGHAKKLAEEENLQELSKDTLKSYVSKAVKSRDDNDKKAKEHAWRANDAGTIKTLSKHIGKRDKAEKNVANRDKGIKTAKDKIWRKNAQDDYDGPNRDGKKASDGVRHTGD